MKRKPTHKEMLFFVLSKLRKEGTYLPDRLGRYTIWPTPIRIAAAMAQEKRRGGK